jgi:serine protease inhibitor
MAIPAAVSAERLPHIMMLRRTAALLAAAALLASCDGVTGPGDLKPTWSKVALDERVTDAYGDFGFELYRRLRDADPTGNVFISPTSAAFALAMTYNGARGETAAQMAAALGIGHLDRETINETSRRWLAALRATGDPGAELAVANGVWHLDSYPVLDSFRQRAGSQYGAEIQPITTAAAINAWVDQATRGRIRKIVDGEIPGDVVAYLINAIYFKADWTHQFDAKRTRPAPFYRADGSPVQVQMMSQTGDFEIRSDESAMMLRLPYGAGRFSMILALPHESAGLPHLAARLNADRWTGWMTEFSPEGNLTVELPRFEIDWESSLKETLQQMGMVVPFLDGPADFSDMFGARGPWIDDVLQKTYLKVDEKGTQAAAVTTVVMIDRAAAGVTFDRPFFLAIYDHATDTVLFLGHIADPTM